MNNEGSPYDIGFSKLNDFQKNILTECYEKKNGGLSLPMGSGKTLLSLVLGLKLTNTTQSPILIVISKTLLMNWVDEIKKFFGESLKYCVLHKEHIKNISTWVISDDVRVVLTTSDVISKCYSSQNIERRFIIQDIINPGMFNQYIVHRYAVPNTPFSSVRSGPETVFSMKWGCLIVDEIQKFTNAMTKQCRGLAAICSEYRWGLSGTMFDEPKIERILGYHLIINHYNFPRTLPDAQFHVRNRAFRGVSHTIVQRKQNDAFVPPKLVENIVTHKLDREEEKIYMCMKETLKNINQEVERYKRMRDTVNIRRFSSYLLAMITYLRQSVVCPLLPIANVALDMSDYEDKSTLSEMLMKVIKELNIDNWLQNEDSVVSSRIRNVLKIIDNHKHEQLIIFTSFRTCLDILKSQISQDRKQYILTANMSAKTRGRTLQDFEKSSDGILIMTYDLGAEGLNIQSAHTVLLMDLWWNSAKTKQAISRVFRFGQMAPVVNVYYFTSNTGIEKALLDKHTDKLNVIDELQDGPLVSTVKTINMKEILSILETEENVGKLSMLNKRVYK